MEFNYLEKYKYPTATVLNLTDNCNLACIYCFVQQKHHYMSLEIAKKSVDFIVNNYNIKEKNNWLYKNEKKRIGFFGGEPMLMFNSIIVPLVEYIENTYNIEEFDFHITTNGTLLNQENLQFLHKYKIKPLLSMDGNKETQDHNRPCKDNNISSFNLLDKNIPTILEHFPNTAFRSTVYKDTINQIYESYLYAESKGFMDYVCIPDSRSHNWTEDDLNLYKQEILKISSHVLSYYLNNERPKTNFTNLNRALFSILDNDLLITQNEEKNNPHTDLFRCGLGTTSCSINYKGDIFTCQEQDSRETGDYFYIGNIIDGIDIKLHFKILKDYLDSNGICEKENECQNCLLKIQCSHGCPSVQKDIFNDLRKMPYIMCAEFKFTLNIMLSIMDYLVQTNNQIFYTELYNIFHRRRMFKNGEF